MCFTQAQTCWSETPDSPGGSEPGSRISSFEAASPCSVQQSQDESPGQVPWLQQSLRNAGHRSALDSILTSFYVMEHETHGLVAFWISKGTVTYPGRVSQTHGVAAQGASGSI